MPSLKRLLVVAILLLLFVSCASAKSITVGPTNYKGELNFRCDGVQDQHQIQAALNLMAKNNSYSSVWLMPGTYIIDKTIMLPANTVLLGTEDAIIRLKNNVKWSTLIPLFRNSGNHDFLIKGFTIDANSGNQRGVPCGKGYYNIFLFEDCYNIKIKDMNLINGNGDGLNVANYGFNKKDQNIIFVNNTVRALGHDVVYLRGCQGALIKNNKVMTRTNSAFRLSCSGNARIYNNEIYSSLKSIDGFSSTGPGIEIDKDSGYTSDNIRIFNNNFHDMNGAAIWICGEDKDGVVRGKNVRIFNNKMVNVGQYKTNTGYSNSAIIIGQFDKTVIENNYINNGGQSGIKYYQYPKAYKMDQQFMTIVNNNTIINCRKLTGAAVWNYNYKNHVFKCSYNNFYGNNKVFAGTNVQHSNNYGI